MTIYGQVTVPANKLASSEAQAGWRLLFDGKTSSGWKYGSGHWWTNRSWLIIDGFIEPEGKQNADAISEVSLRDFDLAFEWCPASKLSLSYVKYSVTRRPPLPGHTGLLVVFAEGGGLCFACILWLAFRRRSRLRRPLFVGPSVLILATWGWDLWTLYGVLGEERSSPPALAMIVSGGESAAVTPVSAGALAGFIQPERSVAIRVGAFNEGRIVVTGNHIEHWLNGVQVLTYELGSRELMSAIYQKREDLLWLATKRDGPIALGHGRSDEKPVRFRNIKIRRLP